PRSPAEAHQGARPAAGGVRVVSRPAPLRHGPARRIRHGHRARRVVDLQTRARARDDSIPAHAQQAVSLMKVGLISLGCPKNLVDSEVMLGLANEAGHDPTTEGAGRAVLVPNTCASIDPEEQEPT